jgi:hypothetical protein
VADRDPRLDYIVSKTFLDAGILYPHPMEIALRSGQVGHMLQALDSWEVHGPEPITQEDAAGHDEDCNYLRSPVYDEDTETRVRFPCSCPAALKETDATPQA